MKYLFYLFILAPISLLLADEVHAQWNVDSLSIFGLPDQPILLIISNFLSWLLMIFFVVALIAFVIAGIMYLTSTGDDTRITTAKKAMSYSIIGIIVGLSGFVVLQAANYMLFGSTIF